MESRKSLAFAGLYAGAACTLLVVSVAVSIGELQRSFIAGSATTSRTLWNGCSPRHVSRACVAPRRG
jgi:hypothetical protein